MAMCGVQLHEEQRQGTIGDSWGAHVGGASHAPREEKSATMVGNNLLPYLATQGQGSTTTQTVEKAVVQKGKGGEEQRLCMVVFP